MGLFNKKAENVQMSEHAKLNAKYNSSRNNLLLVVAFSLVNTFLLAFGSDTYFLFSASVPYYLTFFGMLYTGKMPAEYYEDIEGFEFFPEAVFVVALVISVVIIGVYALCWLLSKKNRFGWLVFALVCFIIDTIAMFMLAGAVLDNVIDFVFHIWVVVSLISGIIAAVKLRDLPPEEEIAVAYEGGVPEMQYGAMPTPIAPAAPVEEAVEAPVAVADELPKETVNDIPKED